jgi:hypothetical protein
LSLPARQSLPSFPERRRGPPRLNFAVIRLRNQRERLMRFRLVLLSLASMIASCQMLKPGYPDCYENPNLSTAQLVTVLDASLAEGGAIMGRVTDANQDTALVGVPVIAERNRALSDPSFEWTERAHTIEQGYYWIGHLPPGRYSVKSTFIGYDDVTLDSLEVQKNKVSVIDFQLSPCGWNTGPDIAGMK